MPRTYSVREQQELYARFLPVVRRIAMRTVRTLPSSITLDDVISAGWLGLVESLTRRTDEMTDEQFEAFASYRVRGAILDYLRLLDPMSRKLRGASRQVTATVAALVARLGRMPDDAEVARELSMGLLEYQRLLAEIGEVGTARLELSEVPEPSSHDASPEALASRRELVDSVSAAIQSLPQRLQMILGLYYEEDCSFREIGSALGVTESRVCQLHSEAMHLIRAVLDGRPMRRRRRQRGSRAGRAA